MMVVTILACVMPLRHNERRFETLNLQGAPRTIATKKVGEQTQLAQHVARHCFKRPTRVSTNVRRLLLFIEEMVASRIQLLKTLGRG
jgi:hypothetical protein